MNTLNDDYREKGNNKVTEVGKTLLEESVQKCKDKKIFI